MQEQHSQGRMTLTAEHAAMIAANEHAQSLQLKIMELEADTGW